MKVLEFHTSHPKQNDTKQNTKTTWRVVYHDNSSKEFLRLKPQLIIDSLSYIKDTSYRQEIITKIMKSVLQDIRGPWTRTHPTPSQSIYYPLHSATFNLYLKVDVVVNFNHLKVLVIHEPKGLNFIIHSTCVKKHREQVGCSHSYYYGKVKNFRLTNKNVPRTFRSK